MENHYIGKFFRNLIFGKSGTSRIFLLVMLFLMNLGLILFLDFAFIHNIPLPDETVTFRVYDSSYPDFSDSIDGEILDISGDALQGYHVLYRDADGVSCVVELDGSGIFHRYRLIKRSRITIPAGEDPFVYEEGDQLEYLRITVTEDRFDRCEHRDFQLFSGNEQDKLLFCWMLIALIALLTEMYIFKAATGKE